MPNAMELLSGNLIDATDRYRHYKSVLTIDGCSRNDPEQFYYWLDQYIKARENIDSLIAEARAGQLSGWYHNVKCADGFCSVSLSEDFVVQAGRVKRIVLRAGQFLPKPPKRQSI